MITDVAGVRVGHWTDEAARTGCTVVLFPGGTVASGEVRGGAPGTREWALLAPERTVARIDAVVLSGGSAFGLAACDGVMRWCEERGIGFATPAGPVPIVVGAVLYDLLVGDPSIRPTAESGYAACIAASDGAPALGAPAPALGTPAPTDGAPGLGAPAPTDAAPAHAGRQTRLGLIGAGTGATVAKWQGGAQGRPAGLGAASRRHEDLVVAALMAVNAFGDLRPGGPPESLRPVGPGTPASLFPVTAQGQGTNTTIGVIATNATLDKVGCLLVAQSGHDGLARALEPAHTTVDGDALVAAAVGGVTAPLDLVRHLAALVVEDAIRAGAGPA